MGLPICIRTIVDVVILVAVALPVLVFFILGEPFERGFYCDDTSIRYPYKDSTVTTLALYLFGTAIPLISIICIEYILIWKRRNESEKRELMRSLVSSLYRLLGAFLFGCAMSQLTVDICKYSIGRLRPHFIYVCNPDWNKINCTVEPNNFRYVADYVCNTNDEDKLREARLSFMSGHASFSAFTMFYLIFYLQANLRMTQFRLVRPVFQYILFLIALYTTLSRVSDFKHHWSDVFAGFINGLAFAIFMAVFVAKMFKRKGSFGSRSEINSVQLEQIQQNA